MSFVTAVAPIVSDPTRQEWAQMVSDNLNYLASVSSGSSGVPTLVNGSFEVGSGAADPVGWVGARAAGNTTAITTTAADVQHGIQGIKMVTPGGISGGVTLTSDQFYICANGLPFVAAWFIKSTLATTSVSVQIRWYDIAGSVVTTTTLYTATTGIPAAWTLMTALCTPPATAKQFKLILTGVNTTAAASVYWDGITLLQYNPSINTVYLSGSGNHTTGPLTQRLKITFRAAGGGGGGGGQAAITGGNGGTGGDTSFNGSTARGGAPGLGGGPASGPTPGAGGAGVSASYASNLFRMGSLSGTAASTVTGAARNGELLGYGGAGGNGTAGGQGGGSGARGEDAVLWLDVQPLTNYAYAIGAAGTAGTAGGAATPGTAGNTGFIQVEEIG